jgi:hypothetical protein
MQLVQLVLVPAVHAAHYVLHDKHLPVPLLKYFPVEGHVRQFVMSVPEHVKQDVWQHVVPFSTSAPEQLAQSVLSPPVHVAHSVLQLEHWPVPLLRYLPAAMSHVRQLVLSTPEHVKQVE